MSNNIDKVEVLRELYFDQAALKNPLRQLFRTVVSGKRYYYYFNDVGAVIVYAGVTTVLRNVVPVDDEILKWYGTIGYEGAVNYIKERSHYGTFMHMLAAELLINNKINLDGIKDQLKQYIEVEQLPLEYMKFEHEAKKAMCSLAQWMMDYKVKPIAIEMCMASDRLRLAGTEDLVCKLTIEEKGYFGEVYKSGEQKGKPKESKEEREVIALVDFKSSKSFREEHEIQLECYKLIWEDNFPETPIEKTFNWRPKDFFGTTASYEFKDQTNGRGAQKLPLLLQLYDLNRKHDDPNVFVFGSEINLEEASLQPIPISNEQLEQVIMLRHEAYLVEVAKEMQQQLPEGFE